MDDMLTIVVKTLNKLPFKDNLLLDVQEMLSQFPTMDSFYSEYAESFDPYFK